LKKEQKRIIQESLRAFLHFELRGKHYSREDRDVKKQKIKDTEFAGPWQK